MRQKDNLTMIGNINYNAGYNDAWQDAYWVGVHDERHGQASEESLETKKQESKNGKMRAGNDNHD